MKETGLMFKAPLVRAVLAGQKTQTRRVLSAHTLKLLRAAAQIGEVSHFLDDGHMHPNDLPYVQQFSQAGQPGDRIYVRETFAPYERDCFYRADSGSAAMGPWKPAIHMPKALARIWLEVTGVRVERLQQITEEDAKAEGAQMKNSPAAHLTNYRRGFQELWESTGGDWAANQFVWVIDFKTISTTGRPA